MAFLQLYQKMQQLKADLEGKVGMKITFILVSKTHGQNCWLATLTLGFERQARGSHHQTFAMVGGPCTLSRQHHPTAGNGAPGHQLDVGAACNMLWRAISQRPSVFPMPKASPWRFALKLPQPLRLIRMLAGYLARSSELVSS